MCGVLVVGVAVNKDLGCIHAILQMLLCNGWAGGARLLHGTVFLYARWHAPPPGIKKTFVQRNIMTWKGKCDPKMGILHSPFSFKRRRTLSPLSFQVFVRRVQQENVARQGCMLRSPRRWTEVVSKRRHLNSPCDTPRVSVCVEQVA